MSVWSKVFVAFVFTILSVSFIVTTVVYIREFRPVIQDEWQALGLLYSHLFLFFPTMGIIALIAFYIPACVFVDLYWRHIKPAGPFRFMAGAFTLSLMSFLISQLLLKGDVPAIWQIKPEVLKQDQGVSTTCTLDKLNFKDSPCHRIPIMQSVSKLNEESGNRFGLSRFTRECHIDELFPEPEARKKRIHCFPNGELSNADTCCLSQKAFSDSLEDYYKDTRNHSQTGQIHALLLPLKVFFLLVLLTIGFMLAYWRHLINEHYEEELWWTERGILVGALVMIVWPASNHAFVHSSELLYGQYIDSIFIYLAPAFSLIFGIWALMLMFFFYRHMEKNLDAAIKIIGFMISIVAFLKYDIIIDWATRIAGSGASMWTLGGLAAFVLFMFFPLYGGRHRKMVKDDNKAE